MSRLMRIGLIGLGRIGAFHADTLAALDRVAGGESVTIGEGATLRSCVLFDGCAIAAGAQLTDAIVTPEGVFQCAPSEDAP